MMMTSLLLALVSTGTVIGLGIGYSWGHTAGTENGFTLARIAQDKQKRFWDEYAADQLRRMNSVSR
jgi:hypothetical protein